MKGIDGATRDKAREAAQAAGLPIGAWIDKAILRARSGEFDDLVAPIPQTPSADAGTVQDTPPPPAATSPGPDEISVQPDSPDNSAAASDAVLPPEEAPADPVSPDPAAPETAPRRPIVADPDARVMRPSASNDDTPPDQTMPEQESPETVPELRPLSPQVPARPPRSRIFAAAGVLAVLLAGSVWLLVEMSSMDAPSPPKVTAEPQPAPAASADTETPAQTKPATGTPGIPDEVRTVRELANAGDAKAQHDMALLYLSGRHVPKDPSQAAAWFEKAAVQGLANAQFNLGVLYQRGEGMTQNDRLAFFWYQSAAEQGLARAQHNLATAYADGRGTKINYPKAVE